MEVGSFLFMQNSSEITRVPRAFCARRFPSSKPGHSDVEMIGKMTRGFRLSERERAHTEHPTCPVGWPDRRQTTEKIGEAGCQCGPVRLSSRISSGTSSAAVFVCELPAFEFPYQIQVFAEDLAMFFGLIDMN